MVYIPTTGYPAEEDEDPTVHPEKTSDAHAIEKARKESQSKGKPKAAIIPLDEFRDDGESLRAKRFGTSPECDECDTKIRAKFDTGGYCVSCLAAGLDKADEDDD